MSNVVFQIGRRFRTQPIVPFHDQNGKKRSVQLNCLFKELLIDESQEITQRANRSMLEEALLEVSMNLDLHDEDGNEITDPDLIRETVLNVPTLAKGAMDSYWEETIKKKE